MLVTCQPPAGCGIGTMTAWTFGSSWGCSSRFTIILLAGFGHCVWLCCAVTSDCPCDCSVACERCCPNIDNIGKTVGTLLCLTEPVWGSGRVFVLDSGFCVLQVIVELWKKGVFTVALIKKHHYRPKYIPGNNMISHFAEKGIGELDALQGMLDDVKFHVVAMKEPTMYISAPVQPHRSIQNAVPLSMSLPWSHLTKKISRATHQFQDKIWQVEMHGLHLHCEVILFMYTRTDVLHWLLW